jgi:heterodisulfide reductase subunit B
MAAVQKAGIEYNDSVTINHVAESYLANLERLQSLAKYSLRGLRAVTHHGCHYSKIYYKEVASGNFERPTLLDRVLEGFGAKVVDYPERSLCCGLGFHHIMLYPDYTQAVTRRKYSGIVEANPDLLVTMCAGCTLSLDMCQEKLLRELGVERDIPVLNISELIALLLGADPYKVAGIDLHGVPIEPLLKKIGVPGARE